MQALLDSMAVMAPFLKWWPVPYLVFAAWVTHRINRRLEWSAAEQDLKGRAVVSEAMTAGRSPGVAWPAVEIDHAGAGKRKGAGWLQSVFVFVLFLALSAGALVGPVAVGERIAVFFRGESTLATVVSVESKRERTERTDSDNRRYYTMITMYTPVYAFTLADGSRQQARGDIASSHEPLVGETQEIFYNPRNGQVASWSVVNIVLLAVGALFCLLLVLAYLGVLKYAMRSSFAEPD